MTVKEQLLIEKIRAGLQAIAEIRRETLAIEATAYRGAILINGAAAIALLAFTGNIWSSDQSNLGVRSLSLAILYFAAGVVIATFGTAINYFIQHRIATRFTQDQLQELKDLARQLEGESIEQQKQRPLRNTIYLAIAALFIVAAIVCFCLGVGETYQAFTSNILSGAEQQLSPATQ